LKKRGGDKGEIKDRISTKGRKGKKGKKKRVFA